MSGCNGYYGQPFCIDMVAMEMYTAVDLHKQMFGGLWHYSNLYYPFRTPLVCVKIAKEVGCYAKNFA
jgi:hypothetical protein